MVSSLSRYYVTTTWGGLGFSSSLREAIDKAIENPGRDESQHPNINRIAVVTLNSPYNEWLDAPKWDLESMLTNPNLTVRIIL